MENMWFLIGLGFFIAEFVLPSFILFFFGIGSWIVYILLNIFDLTANQQILVFIVSSVTSLLLFRNYFFKIFSGDQNSGADNYSDPLQNKSLNLAIVTKAIDEKGNGEIKFQGTFYKAQANENIAKGEQVQVIKKGDEQGSFFIVKK